MNEQDMLNRDAMFWREISYYLPSEWAELECYESIMLGGKETQTIICALLPFHAENVVHELENGGAMNRNEVVSWFFILPENRSFFERLETIEDRDASKVESIPHDEIKSITLRNKKGEVIFSKVKI